MDNPIGELISHLEHQRDILIKEAEQNMAWLKAKAVSPSFQKTIDRYNKWIEALNER